jgi:hypothetical protein
MYTTLISDELVVPTVCLIDDSAFNSVEQDECNNGCMNRRFLSLLWSRTCPVDGVYYVCDMDIDVSPF